VVTDVKAGTAKGFDHCGLVPHGPKDSSIASASRPESNPGRNPEIRLHEGDITESDIDRATKLPRQAA
jgi:hypothetical protein